MSKNTTTTTREQVLEYFRSDRSYQQAQRLYLGLPFYNRALAREFNRPHTPERLDLLRYHLAKAVGISEREWRRILRSDIAPKASPDIAEAGQGSAPPLGGDTSEQLRAEFAAHPSAAQGHRLVVDFPFLTLPDTPQEIKDLAEDKVSAWMRLQVAREDLFRAVTPQQCYQAAAAASEALALNQDIWDELVAYRDTGRPLYKVPQLQFLRYKDSLRGKSEADLVKALHNARSRRSRAKDPDKAAQWDQRVKYLEGLLDHPDQAR